MRSTASTTIFSSNVVLTAIFSMSNTDPSADAVVGDYDMSSTLGPPEMAKAYTAWKGDAKRLKAADFDNIMVEEQMYEFDVCRARKGNQYEYEY